MSSPGPRPRIIFFLLVWATNIGFTLAATSTTQFKHWYPQYGRIFTNIVRTNCSAEYERYTTGSKNHSEIDWMAGGGIYTALTQPVIDCILENTSEFLKGSMTGAQILLGVMPTIVALLGPSHDEIAMLSNVGRRPLLAAALALASPSAYFSRAFEYKDVAEILSSDERRFTQWRPSRLYSKIGVSFVEYALAAAACFNVVINTLQVSRSTVSTISTDTDFMPKVWLGLGFFIHVFSGLVFRLRLRGWRIMRQVKQNDDQGMVVIEKTSLQIGPMSCPLPTMEHVENSNRNNKPGSKKNKGEQEDPENDSAGLRDSFFRLIKSLKNSSLRLITSFRDWIKNIGPRLVAILATTEFVPCAAKGYQVHILTFDETKTFLLLAWLLSTFTILHVVFGTLVFAGILFVGLKDALSIVGRYIAAVVLCRVILMYELAGMRECWESSDGQEADKDWRCQCKGEAEKEDGEERSSTPKNESVATVAPVSRPREECCPC